MTRNSNTPGADGAEGAPSTDKTTGGKTSGEKANWTNAAALAGAAIGSAALAGALLYASRRKEGHRKPTAPPHRPEDAPETD